MAGNVGRQVAILKVRVGQQPLERALQASPDLVCEWGQMKKGAMWVGMRIPSMQRELRSDRQGNMKAENYEVTSTIMICDEAMRCIHAQI
eukprot:334762-Pelagomonas_calceolata.AAC.1